MDKPVTKEDCYYLGLVSKLQGYQGRVILFLDVDAPEEYSGLDSIYIDMESGLVPFFIEEIDIQQRGYARVKFEGVDSAEEAEVLKSRELYLPLDALPEPDKGEFYLHEIEDFHVLDVNNGDIGQIREIVQSTSNPYIIVTNENGEVIIPLNRNFVGSIDRDSKVLHVELPEGMIDLNY